MWITEDWRKKAGGFSKKKGYWKRQRKERNKKVSNGFPGSFLISKRLKKGKAIPVRFREGP
jgi:hypothetical protein